MSIKDVFREKQTYNLENAEPIKKYLNRPFKIEGFETYYSKQYKADFGIIETQQGHLVHSWSKVVTQKLKQLAEYPMNEVKEIELKAVEKKSENGYNYIDLELVE